MKAVSLMILKKNLDIPLLQSVNSFGIMKKLILLPAIMLLLTTQACYTQLAWFHMPEPEKETLYGESDPYGLSDIERSSDFEPYLGSTYNGRRYYGYDPSFWSNYGYNGSPFSLYSPYNSYSWYPYYNSGYNYGLTTSVIVNENNVRDRRNWDRRGNESSGQSNLIIRREPPLAAVTAKPIRNQLPIPNYNTLVNYQKRWDVSNSDYNRPSYRSSSSSRSGGSNSSSGRSFSSGSSSSSSGTSSSSSSGGRVTRRR